jgi:membrane protein
MERNLLKNVYKELMEDRAFGRAAELAFFLILALFPLLICILSLLTFIPGARQLALNYLSEIMPREAMGLMRDWVAGLVNGRNSAVFSFGLLFTLWSASSGIAALMDVLNVAYDLSETRSMIKKRLLALILTIALALLILGGLGLVIYGGYFARLLLSQIDSSESYYWISRGVSYLGGILLLFAALQFTYNFAPNVDRGVNRTWPGAVFGIVGILLFSYLFSVYLRFVPSYSRTYGSLGAVIVLMLWIYVVGLIIMIGAEINSELIKKSRRGQKNLDHGSDLRTAFR